MELPVAFLFTLCCELFLPMDRVAASAAAAETDVLRHLQSNSSDEAAHHGVPVFQLEPDELYVIVKSKPLTITCRASPAMQINFMCGGQWIHPNKHANAEFVDSETREKGLETSIEITKEEVEDEPDPGKFWCECHAWNSLPDNQPRSVKSRRGLIQAAYLRKRFEREPINTIVEVKSPAQLQCLPPVGLPLPEVFWMKDGEMIDARRDVNLIVSNEGSLIINQARLTDSGNYTCGAQNIASRRLSEFAFLTVYVNGGWSAWGPWSECSSQCGRAFQRRIRICANPSPTNGGAPCQGDSFQRLTCPNTCPVDGVWSTWSSWSTCNSDCRQHRRRICDGPPSPIDGAAHHCTGSDLDSSNCTGGMCKDVMSSYNGFGSGDGGALTTELPIDNGFVYIGLTTATMFLFTVLIIVFVVRRRKVHVPVFVAKQPQIPQDLFLQPDITKTVFLARETSVTGGGFPNNSLHASSEKFSLFTDNAFNVTMIQCGESPYSQLMSTTESLYSQIKTDSDSYDPKQDTTTSRQQQQLSPCCSIHAQRTATFTFKLPCNVDVNAITWARFTPSGGRLTIPESGVSLTVPEGALPNGCSQEIFLTVSRDDKDRPKLHDSQTMLSPVIVCGPQSLTLRKPVILSFHHCASIKHGHWTLFVHGSSTSYDELPQWQMLSKLGHETINTEIYAQIDVNQCHIMTENLMRFTLTGEPTATARAFKILRLAVFTPAVSSSNDYNLRIYFVEDTYDAIEGVMQVEGTLGGRLLDAPKNILFQSGGGNLCLSIENLHSSWQCKMSANCQEIPFSHIWSGTQNCLHCSFALEHLIRTDHLLTCDIYVFQKLLPINRQVLQISHNLLESMDLASTDIARQPELQNWRTGTSGTSNLEPPHHKFGLPTHIKSKLCEILDVPNARGSDWRMLAQRLGVDRYINYFATKPSPTDTILDLWEVRHREQQSTVADLLSSLRAMGRMDAAALIEQDAGGHNMAWL